MTEQTNPPTPDPTSTGDAAHGSAASSSPGATAAGIIGSIREAVDDLAERAAPTVREVSAKVAELTATAADKAAPIVRRAGEVTADASGKLAEKSRSWAAEVRESLGGADAPARDAAEGDAASDAADTASDAADAIDDAAPRA